MKLFAKTLIVSCLIAMPALAQWMGQADDGSAIAVMNNPTDLVLGAKCDQGQIYSILNSPATKALPVQTSTVTVSYGVAGGKPPVFSRWVLQNDLLVAGGLEAESFLGILMENPGKNLNIKIQDTDYTLTISPDSQGHVQDLMKACNIDKLITAYQPDKNAAPEPVVAVPDAPSVDPAMDSDVAPEEGGE